ncbi:thioesterase domain-containing protein [Streptomyces sp. NPDC001792]|uniref:thioesterase II family protein n=1 Tax=Streptomyces sp. NPDC001792 TaxID=3154524 RepID=UPI003320F005
MEHRQPPLLVLLLGPHRLPALRLHFPDTHPSCPPRSVGILTHSGEQGTGRCGPGIRRSHRPFPPQLRERAALQADRLFVSGRRSPSSPTTENVHLRDEQGLLREVRALDGTGASMLDDPDVRAMILSPLRADYQALETYRYRPSRRLAIPVTAVVGDGDPRTPVDDAAKWGEVTAGDFDLHVLPGGHFYLVDQWPTLTELLAGKLAGTGRVPL